MPNLNVYINGSPGGTDGTFIDPVTSFLDLSGIYPIGGVDKHIIVPLCLRCNTGFRAESVRITPADNFRLWASNYYKSMGSASNWGQFDVAGSYFDFSTGNTYWLANGMTHSSELTYIGNTNVLIIGAYLFNGTPAAGTRNMFSISYVETAV